MDSLLEKFSKLGCDNAPGQEGRQKAAVLDLRGEKLEGRLVDFSHGDVDAHPPIPGTLSDFVTGVEKIGVPFFTRSLCIATDRGNYRFNAFFVGRWCKPVRAAAEKARAVKAEHTDGK